MPCLQLMGECLFCHLRLVWMCRVYFHVATYCVLVSLLSYFPSRIGFRILYCGCVTLHYFLVSDNAVREVAMFLCGG